LVSVNEVSCGNGSVALRVTGVVDDDTVEQFEQAVEGAVGAGLDSLVLDLTSCRLESAGLAALIRLQRSEERRPEATLLVTTDVDLLWTLQVVGLTYFCEVFATLEAALDASSATALSIAGAPYE
jgi:anti-anti-sigma regulatory factor